MVQSDHFSSIVGWLNQCFLTGNIFTNEIRYLLLLLSLLTVFVSIFLLISINEAIYLHMEIKLQRVNRKTEEIFTGI